jgi:putative transcription factor
MPCEMCGADRPNLRRARVEGTVMMVCSQCIRFGEEIEPRPAATPARAPPTPVADRLAARQRRMETRDALDSDEELVEDFGERVKRAREKKGWTREDLAGKVGQPVPTIAQIEAGKLHPADSTVKALEKHLGVKLMEAVPRTQLPRNQAPGTQRGLTLGDLLEEAKKKAK